MEVFLYNSTVCRLCGEENDNGTLLYSHEENNQNLSEIINTYLPIKVSDDGQLPRTICPGCTIQIEATVEFITLIINGQKIIRELYQREREYKKTLLNSSDNNESNVITENIVYEINTEAGVYQVAHPVALQVAGLQRPKRKRGRPPKQPKSPEQAAREAAARAEPPPAPEDVPGKRRRKTPTRFKEAVQGKELERIFKEEGVTDGEESEPEPAPREPEVIGHLEASGELVVVVRGKRRGRPRGRMRPTREVCAICGLEFSCAGRYMAHVAAHGPVTYRCRCGAAHDTRLALAAHQRAARHKGHAAVPARDGATPEEQKPDVQALAPDAPDAPVPDAAVPDASGADVQVEIEIAAKPEASPPRPASPPAPGAASPPPPAGKPKLKCPQCEKLFSNKQSRSLHVKAVHEGVRPYSCRECGATFAYPRSLALHALAHRRTPARGFACDLCGKVLNHPSSVVYHKEAEHAGQRYVCGKCGKPFKHRQLLQRHQLVHSQARPYSCKVCGTSFKTKANLLNHSLLHSGVKRFACELCKHRFAHKTSLTLHMRWHSGLKPFSCATCGKSFSQKGNLSEHERIHTGEKPYQCTLCPRRFTTSSQHRLHARRHLEPRRAANAARPARPARFRCGVCARGFGARAALLRHARRHARAADTPDKKGSHKPVSVLSAPASDEQVIYVSYDSAPAAFSVAPRQLESLRDERPPAECALYSGASLLLPPAPREVQIEEEIELSEPLVLEENEHMPVTDEQGNPLHFTMQDGTRLAITSADGKSLQVITQDGQTIPVEINGFAEEEEAESPDTIVHHLNLQKAEPGAAQVAHYFTIV